MNERRKHCRVAGVMVSDTIVRVRPGCDGTLINMSRGGALIEVRRPMPPGTYVDVHLSDAQTRSIVRALVLRCTVHAVAALEGVTYQAALLFEHERGPARETDARNGYPVHTGRDVQIAVNESELPVDSSAWRAPGEEAAK